MNNDYVNAKASTNGYSIICSRQSGRIAYLDALKAFAILLVVEGHVRILGMGISPYESLSGLMLYSLRSPFFSLLVVILLLRHPCRLNSCIKV